MSLLDIGDWCGDNVQAMLCECCVNVTPQCWWPMLRPSSGNIVWTLWQCHSPMSVTDIKTIFRQCVRVAFQWWWPTLRQCSGNNVWTLWQRRSPTLVTDVETIFRQHFVNVMATSLPNIGDRHWDNIQATLPKHCLIVAPQCWGLILRQWLGNIVYQC